jgi:hypothetical protein
MKNEFIQVEIEVYNRELADLGVESKESIWADAVINESEVAAIRASLDNNDRCVIYLKNGDNFIIRMHLYEAVWLFTDKKFE